MTADHSLQQTDTSTTWYPPHPPRVATALYVKSHHDLCVVQNKACWACGIKNSDIVAGGPNIAPALAMETHHFWCEDAFTGEGAGLGGIYWPRIQSDHPTFDWTGSGFVLADPTTWQSFVDSEFNLQVLCSQCHRAAKPVRHWRAGQADPDRGGLVWLSEAASVGIHHISYPEYRDQRHSRPDVAPFRVAGGAPVVAVVPLLVTPLDSAAVTQLAATPMPGHAIDTPAN